MEKAASAGMTELADSKRKTDADGEESTPPMPRASLSLRALSLVALIFGLYFGRPFLMPVVLALVFWMLLRPVVRWLNERLHLPNPAGAALILLILLTGMGAGVAHLSAPAQQWLDKAPTTMQELDSRLGVLKQKLTNMQKATDRLDTIAQIGQKPSFVQVAVKPESIGSRIFSGAQSFVFSAFAVVVLVFFLLSSGELFLKKVVRVSYGLRNKIRAVEIARTVEQEVGRYLAAITLINVGLGIATAAAMTWLGMPNPLLWGAMVAAFNFVPYVGATVSTIILALVALMSFDQIGQALLVPAVFMGITILEGQFFQPLVVGRQCAINPVLVFVALMFWGWLWGVAGLLVAVPILVVLKVLSTHVEELSALHEFLSRQ